MGRMSRAKVDRISKEHLFRCITKCAVLSNCCMMAASARQAAGHIAVIFIKNKKAALLKQGSPSLQNQPRRCECEFVSEPDDESNE